MDIAKGTDNLAPYTTQIDTTLTLYSTQTKGYGIHAPYSTHSNLVHGVKGRVWHPHAVHHIE